MPDVNKAGADGDAESPAGVAAPRPGGLTTGIRATVVAFGLLGLIAFGPLYVLSDRTEQLFSWTIHPPVTAAFLGAGYGAGLTGAVAALWSGRWQHIKLWVVGFFVFVTVTSAATFLHLGRFHFDGSGLARVAAWAWLVVYIVLPIWGLALLIGVRNTEVGQADQQATWPASARVVLWTQAIALGAVGITLFAAPTTASWLWPWELTPLTARAVAAWLLASATLAVVMAREEGPARVEVTATAYAAQPVLMGVALPRFFDQVAWHEPAGYLFVVLLAAMAATGLVAFALSLRSEATVESAG